MNKFNNRAVAVEMVNAGKCNMDCAYCYIPKSKEMNRLHDRVVAYLESGDFIDDLYALYGDELECIAPWGTEPTLTIDILTKWIPRIFETFPKLEAFTMSSNFMRNPKYLVEFIKAIPKDRTFTVRLQYSLDGPEWITDVTRHPKATKRIIQNLKTFLSEIAKLDLGNLEVFLNCKPTWDEDVITQVGQDVSLIEEFLHFFNDLFGEIDQIIAGTTICHGKVHAPYLALPGQYTQQHGIYWADINRRLFYYQNEHRTNGMFPNLTKEFTAYQPRFQRILDYGREYYTKPEMFSCSAGDTQFGLDHSGYLHACHRTFYLNDDDYVESIRRESTNGNWDLEHYKNARLGDIRTNMMAKADNEDDCRKFVYNTAAHHYFIQGKLGTIAGLTIALAKAGQINEIYEDEVVARLFAEFVATAFNCSVEYNLTLGNANLVPIGLIRLCCNGMFEDIVRYATEGWDRTIDEWFKL
jgi:hypothetical protein